MKEYWKYLSIQAVVLFACCLVIAADVSCQEGQQDIPDVPEEAAPRRIIQMGNIQVLGGYSDINTGSPLWGYNVSGFYSPAVRLNEKNYLIPLYNGAYKRMRQYVTQEEGGRLYNNWQIHNGSIALRSKLSDTWSSRLTALATWNFVKETRDESFGKGLYDYEDYGGSADFRHISPIDEKRENMQTVGFQYFHRDYPHYQSLISLAAQTAVEKKEKDFDGVKFSGGFEAKNTQGLNWEAKPSLLLKYFIDKRLIDEGGVLDMDKKRRDYVVTVELNGMYPVKRDAWEIAIDNSLDYNYSNLGYYDSTNNDVYTKNYYTYLSLFTYPYLTYYYPLGKDKRVSLRCGYSFLLRDYSDRKAQESGGVYTNNDQRDKEHAFHINCSFPLTKKISWITSYDYTWARSNQKYEKYYTYSYDVYQVQSGFSVDF